MRFRSIALSFLMCVGAAAVAQAQGTADPNCLNAPKQVRDACQETVDMYQLMMPQLGFSITGGNATLGQGGALGGLGHFAVDIRGNVLFPGSLPDIQNAKPDTSGMQQRAAFPTKDIPLGLPAVDAAVGLFKGIPLGLTNVGGVDLLLSAAYIPNVNHTFQGTNPATVDVSVESPLKIGYGARIGLLQESLVIPGVAVTYFKRDLPVTTIVGAVASQGLTDGSQDSLVINNFTEKTTAWRVVASKNLLLFGLAVGYGQDKYESAVGLKASVTRDFGGIIGKQTVSTPLFQLSQDMTRSTMFADATLNLFLLKLVAEVGQVSGGTVNTFNTFDPKADASRKYVSAGIRLGF
jgi:energy-converting hydrogenase Eha subunit A